MSNDKTYTEVVVELKAEMGDLRVDFIDRLNDNQVAVLDRLDVITSGQSAAEERDKAQGKQIEDNRVDIKTNADGIVKVRNLNATITAAMSGLAAFIGLQK
jgi:3-phenylpropionate/cinnamic acid dioxygenase small subunit